ncbi:hypothetical protein ACEYYH_00880 [Microbacterium trichothecenolyticum]|uniref:hypothetical protein n=1 Tax=Microbacterium trichothecenolyticum TaxID=69370 RepID=UPI0035BE28C4
MSRISTIALVITAVLAIATTAPAPAARADEVSEVCTIGGVAVPVGQPLPDNTPLVTSCFDTIEQAEAFIDAGAPGDLERLVPQARTSLAPLSTVIIGRQYTSTSRGGSVLVQWGTGSGCYGVTYGFASMPNGWNNVIRSSEGFNNCWVSNYTETDYGGSVLICIPYCSTMGSFAALTSSVVYRPSGTFG